MKYLTKIILIIIVTAIMLIWREVSNTHIFVMFPELRPIENNIPVYYKGLLVGKAKERKHSNDSKHTIIKLVLYKKDLKLPINSEVHIKQIVKNKRTKDFLEIIYPKVPSSTLISNGAYLKGISTVDIESYYKSVPMDDLEKVKQNLVESTENLNIALEALGQLFVTLQDTVNENRENLKSTSKNLDNISENINQSSLKINNTIKEKQLESMLINIENSINNVNSMSSNFNNNMPLINESVEDAQNILSNTSAITCGIRQTLGKSLGGLRLIFGKTIDKKQCSKCK